MMRNASVAARMAKIAPAKARVVDGPAAGSTRTLRALLTMSGWDRSSCAEVAAAEFLGAVVELRGAVGAHHGHVTVVPLQARVVAGGARAGGAKHDVDRVGGDLGHVLFE